MKKLIKYNLIKDYHDLKSWISLMISVIGVRAIGMIRGFFVAKVLGPSDYGLLSSLQLINSLNKYGVLGFNAVVKREVSYLESHLNSKEVEKIKNVGYSSEIIFASFLLTIGLVSAYFVPKHQLAVVLASLGLFFAKIVKIFRTEVILEKKFIEIAKFNIIVEMIVAGLVIATVKTLGIFSSLIFSIIGSFCFLFLFSKMTDFKFQFVLIISEVIRQIKIGLPLVLHTLAYGSYRYAEKLVILFFLGTIELGLYSLAEKIADSLLNLLMVRNKNISITISNELGEKNYKYAHKHLISNTLFLFSMSVVLSILGIFIFERFIPFLFGQEYLMSIDIIKILVFSVPIRTIGGFIVVFITSPLINKQKLLPLFQFLSTIVFILTVIIFHLTKEINILYITYANLIGYTFWHLSLIILYIKYFFRKFLK